MQGRALLATRGAHLAVGRRWRALAGATRADDCARTSRRCPARVFARSACRCDDAQQRRPVRGGARRAVGGGAARHRRQLRGPAAAAPACAGGSTTRRWRACATLGRRRPGADRAAHRPAAGARTTGCTRGCFSPEPIRRERRPCTTSARPRTTHHARRSGQPRRVRRAPGAARAATIRARAFTVGIGGPVGSGKTALLLALCRALRDDHNLGVVTNDIFTQGGRRVPGAPPGARRPSASAPSRPAAARTPRSATTSARTSSRSSS